MTTKRAAKASPNPYLTTNSPDELDPASRIAHDIITHRRDVLPSVERIMNAGLDDENTVRALTMFRQALETTGDPHRDPRVAIAECTPSD